MVKKQTRQNLTRLADQLGLTLHTPKGCFGFLPQAPILLGRHRGREVGFFSFTTGAEKSKRSWLGVFAYHAGDDNWVVEICQRTTFWTLRPGLKRRVHIVANPAISAESKVVPAGYNKVPNFTATLTEDEAFDRLYSIKSNLPDGLPDKFFHAIRDRLIDDKPADGRVAVNDGQVMFIYPGSFFQRKQLDRIAAQLDFVCDLAERIET
jgi:hypothetical protein